MLMKGFERILVIWNKLKQGNGRGTCCWSIIYFIIVYRVY